MNLRLKSELERLGQTLAERQQQPLTLFSLPEAAPLPLPDATGTVRRDAFTPDLEETVESFSQRLVDHAAVDLNPLALRIYGIVHLIGCIVARTRGYHHKAGQVSYFCPAEAICAHLGISRGSFYRSLKELLALGLVDARGHKTTLNGWAVRCDGTLWCVKLRPRKGSRARLRYDDLKARYRDLEADIAEGRTVWQQMRQSNTDKTKSVSIGVLLAWTLPPVHPQDPVTLTVSSSERLNLEILLDVPFAPNQGKREAVDRAAQALAQHLGDAGSLNFYRYLVWQLLRLSQQGRGYFETVYTMVLRVQADLREGFARKPGALFVTRLKACDLWSELKEVPSLRVA